MVERTDEMIHIRCVSGLDDLLIRRIRAAIAQVFHHRSAKQPGILQHHAKQRTQVTAAHLRSRDAVNVDRSAVQLIETHEQLDDGRLAGAGRSDDGDLAPRFDIHGPGHERRRHHRGRQS